MIKLSNSTKYKKVMFLFLAFFALHFNKISSQNNALNFDGINDKIDINNSASLNFAVTDKFSIEAWFKSTGTVYRIFVSNRIDVTPFTGYEFLLNNGSIDFSICSTNPSNSMKVLTVNNTFNDGNWHHAVAVYKGIPNGNNVDIFVDGILQAKTIPFNTLSGVITNTNLVTIGSRQGTSAYNFIGSIDEVRIWKKELCAQEIVAKKNCHLIGNEYGLVAYYNFNQGIAAANNPTVTNITDLSLSTNTGTLTGFALNGATSNWIASTASVIGNCSLYGILAVSGTTALCIGTTFSTTLTASGANTYTWSTSANSASISVSPTVNTTYSLTATDANFCITSQTVAVSLNALPNVLASSNTSLICIGQSSTLTASGASTYTWNTSSNAIAIIISPTISTTYTISGTNSVGCNNSSSITQSVSLCTGINNSSLSNQIDFLIYPNPNSGTFNLKADANLKIKLVNELGLLIKIINLDETNNRTENIKDLNSGIYFLLAEDNLLVFKKKIIVSN